MNGSADLGEYVTHFEDVRQALEGDDNDTALELLLDIREAGFVSHDLDDAINALRGDPSRRTLQRLSDWVHATLKRIRGADDQEAVKRSIDELPEEAVAMNADQLAPLSESSNVGLRLDSVESDAAERRASGSEVEHATADRAEDFEVEDGSSVDFALVDSESLSSDADFPESNPDSSPSDQPPPPPEASFEEVDEFDAFESFDSDPLEGIDDLLEDGFDDPLESSPASPSTDGDSPVEDADDSGFDFEFDTSDPDDPPAFDFDQMSAAEDVSEDDLAESTATDEGSRTGAEESSEVETLEEPTGAMQSPPGENSSQTFAPEPVDDEESVTEDSSSDDSILDAIDLDEPSAEQSFGDFGFSDDFEEIDTGADFSDDLEPVEEETRQVDSLDGGESSSAVDEDAEDAQLPQIEYETDDDAPDGEDAGDEFGFDDFGDFEEVDEFGLDDFSDFEEFDEPDEEGASDLESAASEPSVASESSVTSEPADELSDETSDETSDEDDEPDIDLSFGADSSDSSDFDFGFDDSDDDFDLSFDSDPPTAEVQSELDEGDSTSPGRSDSRPDQTTAEAPAVQLEGLVAETSEGADVSGGESDDGDGNKPAPSSLHDRPASGSKPRYSAAMVEADEESFAAKDDQDDADDESPADDSSDGTAIYAESILDDLESYEDEEESSDKSTLPPAPPKKAPSGAGSESTPEPIEESGTAIYDGDLLNDLQRESSSAELSDDFSDFGGGSDDDPKTRVADPSAMELEQLRGMSAESPTTSGEETSEPADSGFSFLDDFDDIGSSQKSPEPSGAKESTSPGGMDEPQTMNQRIDSGVSTDFADQAKESSSTRSLDESTASSGEVTKKSPQLQQTSKADSLSESTGTAEDRQQTAKRTLPESSSEELGASASESPLMTEAKRLFKAGKLESANDLLQSVLDRNPESVQARKMVEEIERERGRSTTQTRGVGALDGVPKKEVGMSELQGMSLDHRAGFLFSLIDGHMTFDDVIEISSMSRDETVEVLGRMLDEGIISVD